MKVVNYNVKQVNTLTIHKHTKEGVNMAQERTNAEERAKFEELLEKIKNLPESERNKVDGFATALAMVAQREATTKTA